ncbi:glycosyltransferase family 2 protein [Yersinia kristensenii]|uniref:glycosyltransferase family 2 protein n=1 Tax=Yersinia kristensenii TaxID=28152 RepID=UPI0005DC5BEE|nr:glycosyltransferase family 2 protein [Yersinia kristensenii]CFR04480.1 dTDP-rhamnosyl transferase RfbF [Yersinia kristensenii]
MSPKQQFEKVCAIVVGFYPEEIALSRMFDELSGVVGKIYFIDNTPSEEIYTSFRSGTNIDIIYLRNNYGIAYAQNVGIKKAIKEKFSYALLLDQDSTIHSGLVINLICSLDELSKKYCDIACIGPRIFDQLEEVVERSNDEEIFDTGYSLSKQIIASGTLLNLSNIEHIGMMDEDLFIDAVDHEWCWRAIAKGYKVVIDDNVKMTHMIGISRHGIGRWQYIICAPVRHYYQFRNTIILIQREYVPIKWKIKKVSEIFISPLLFLFFGPDRLVRLKYMTKGIIAGIFKRMGRYS